jgi:L-asparaginase
MKNKKICVLYTGGTIGMVPSEKGYKPKEKWLTEQIQRIHLFQNKEVPDFDIIEYEHLIDSSNSHPHHWVKISQDIIKYYNDYDGFVILHGTDTLAYTASALSFMLEGLSKPIICTGSQIPLSQIRTDAIDNILDSLIIAATYQIPEVCIYFNKNLLRGNRTQKVDSMSMQAFQSPNYPPLGKVGININIHKRLILEKPTKNISIHLIKRPKIAEINIFPGIDYTIVRHILNSPLEGIILKTYGAGNIPNDRNLLHTLKDANEKGIIIVNCTQCQKGTVNMSTYETGNILLTSGIISGKDLTDEAALTKLYVLCSKGYSNTRIKELMQKNVRGELTEDA